MYIDHAIHTYNNQTTTTQMLYSEVVAKGNQPPKVKYDLFPRGQRVTGELMPPMNGSANGVDWIGQDSDGATYVIQGEMKGNAIVGNADFMMCINGSVFKWVTECRPSSNHQAPHGTFKVWCGRSKRILREEVWENGKLVSHSETLKSIASKRVHEVGNQDCEEGSDDSCSNADSPDHSSDDDDDTRPTGHAYMLTYVYSYILCR
jgi:hypothetical protein